MTRTPLVLARPADPVAGAGPKGFTCPLGANCSCVFSGTRATASTTLETASPIDDALLADVTHFVDFGWTVVSSAPDEVVLERRLGFSFCVTVLLCLATGFLWLAYAIPSNRRPRIDTRRVTLGADGAAVVSRTVARRRLTPPAA
jgi:hypothetical protein